MINPIKDIYNWQKAAGNLEKPYDDFLESSFQIEEALENLQPQFIVASMFNEIQEDFNGDRTSAKEVARLITRLAMTSDLTTDLDGTVFTTNAILPDTPYWDGTEWSTALDNAISNEDSYIRDGDGTLFKIFNKDSVQKITPPITDVDRLDKACDAIVYAIGSIAKLGLDHHGITKALNIVNNANKAKLGMARDKHGKLLKPANYTGPEAELAKLLSETRR